MDLQLVLEHLASVDCDGIEPVTLWLGSQKYGALRYAFESEVPQGSPAYLRGERTFVRSGYYVLGTLPPSYRRSTKVAYQFQHPGTDWYIASHYEGEPNEFHPSGPMFLLFPWDVEPAIDHYESRPRRRYQICAV